VSAVAATASNLALRLVRRDEIALVLFLLVLVVVFGLVEPRAVRLGTLVALSREIAPNLIAALGVAILMLGREFDISVGSMLALAGVIMLEVVNLTGSAGIGVVGTLLAGATVGALHGLLVAYFRLNSLMTTLGTLFLIRGAVYVWTGQVTITTPHDMHLFTRLYHGELIGIPMPAVLVIILYVVAGWVMHRTPLGRSIYAMGGNEEAARASGIRVRWLTFGGFVASGMLASLAGLLLAAQTGTAFFNAGLMFEFIVIAAVVVGGVSLLGGRGTIYGAALGVIIIGFTGKSLRMVGLHTTWQLISTGVLMMVALYLYGFRARMLLGRARGRAKEMELTG
jgi:ribose/xylose/arabinose/galactoside ABC-type transport system permease subunit